MFGRIAACVTLAAVSVIATAPAQTAPVGAAPGPSSARVAVDSRKAALTLIGANFRPLAAVLKGGPFDAADAQKRADRLAFLAGLLAENFPDVSNLGEPDTKAKSDIWANRADFDKKLANFQADVGTLVKVSASETSASDTFKAAVVAVGQDCKACHDNYRIQ